MAGSSHRARVSVPQINPFWGDESESEPDTSDDDNTTGSESDAEDGEEGISDDEVDDPVLHNRHHGPEACERIPYPSVATKWQAPDGTSWSNLPDPLATRPVANYFVPRDGKCGVRSHVDGVSEANSIVEFFNLLFDDRLVSLVVRWTNGKAENSINAWNLNNPTKPPKEWRATDAIEIRAFVGLLILAGSEKCRKMRTQRLWRSDERYRKHPYTATMSRERFRSLIRFLRFDDIETREQRKQSDKLAPIREFTTLVLENIYKVYEPKENLVVDEMLVRFRGRCGFRVYMKSKPGRYGIKVWALSDARSKFVLNFQIYPGKVGGFPELHQGRRVIMDMIKEFENTERGLTADNFFGSMKTAVDLLNKKTTLVCTMRGGRREIPKEILNPRGQNLHETRFYFSGDCMLAAYKSKPNKIVLAMSTLHYDPVIRSAEPKKPQVILHYNATKGGVDTADQMIMEYTVQRPTRRWPVKCFFHQIDIMALNAYVMFMEKNPDWEKPNKSRRQNFLEQLAESLIQPQIQRRSWSGLHKDVQRSLIIMGATPQGVVGSVPGQERNHCLYCNARTSTICTDCKQFFCQDHVIKKKLCFDCNFN